MAALAALLRGINVGGRSILKMADLRALFDALGHPEARTLLQSGNVVFDSRGMGETEAVKRIAAALQEKTGREIGVVIRSRGQLRSALERDPFPEAARDEPNRMIVGFLSGAPPAAKTTAFLDGLRGPEKVQLIGRELYVHYVEGAGASKLTLDRIERGLGVVATGRNWNTLAKLVALTAELEAG